MTDKPTITYEDARTCKASELERGDLIEIEGDDVTVHGYAWPLP